MWEIYTCSCSLKVSRLTDFPVSEWSGQILPLITYLLRTHNLAY